MAAVVNPKRFSYTSEQFADFLQKEGHLDLQPGQELEVTEVQSRLIQAVDQAGPSEKMDHLIGLFNAILASKKISLDKFHVGHAAFGHDHDSFTLSSRDVIHIRVRPADIETAFSEFFRFDGPQKRQYRIPPRQGIIFRDFSPDEVSSACFWAGKASRFIFESCFRDKIPDGFGLNLKTKGTLCVSAATGEVGGLRLSSDQELVITVARNTRGAISSEGTPRSSSHTLNKLPEFENLDAEVEDSEESCFSRLLKTIAGIIAAIAVVVIVGLFIII